MAYIVENDLLMSALLQQLEQNSNVMLKSSASINSVQLPKDGFDCSGVELKTGERFSCDLLVSFSWQFSLYTSMVSVCRYIHEDFILLYADY